MSAGVLDSYGLTRAQFVDMLAGLGGEEGLRYDFMRSGDYRTKPIGALAGRYLDALAFENYSENTVNGRTQALVWLTFDYPNLEPHEVTYDLLRDFLQKHWRDAAPNTKSQHVSTLRCFFAWAYDQDLIPENPAKKLKPPRRTETERRSHSQTVIRRLVVAQDSRRDRVAILTLYWCALRRNELRLVQYRHIDLGRRVLTVFGKGGRVDEQNIPEPLALELERLVQDNDPHPDEYLLYPQKVGRVGGFPAYEHGVTWEDRRAPLSKSGIDKWFQRARKRAGLDDPDDRVLMHELRHSAGTHAQESGHDLLATQHMLRHKSAATTERTYVHLDKTRYVARMQRGMRDLMDEG